MFRMRFGFGCALALTLSSCNSAEDHTPTSRHASGGLESTSSTGNSFAQTLLGTWESNCISNNGEHVKSESRSVQISDGSLIHYYKYFEDTECVEPSGVRTIQRKFTLGKQADYTGVANAYEIDMMIVRIELTIKNEPAAFDFSQNMIYGFDNWQVDVPQEISGRRYKPTSTPGASMGDMYYQIVAIQDGYLAIGDTDGTGNGSSPVNRPTTLPKSVNYVRKK